MRRWGDEEKRSIEPLTKKIVRHQELEVYKKAFEAAMKANQLKLKLAWNLL